MLRLSKTILRLSKEDDLQLNCGRTTFFRERHTFIDDRNNFRWKDVLSTGLRVFIAGIDGATGVAQVSGGGGGTSNDMPWRDKDEDFLDWARRAMRYAHAKHYPGNRFKRSLSK